MNDDSLIEENDQTTAEEKEAETTKEGEGTGTDTEASNDEKNTSDAG